MKTNSEKYHLEYFERKKDVPKLLIRIVDEKGSNTFATFFVCFTGASHEHHYHYANQTDLSKRQIFICSLCAGGC